jgi:hypothetical protein
MQRRQKLSKSPPPMPARQTRVNGKWNRNDASRRVCRLSKEERTTHRTRLGRSRSAAPLPAASRPSNEVCQTQLRQAEERRRSSEVRAVHPERCRRPMPLLRQFKWRRRPEPVHRRWRLQRRPQSSVAELQAACQPARRGQVAVLCRVRVPRPACRPLDRAQSVGRQTPVRGNRGWGRPSARRPPTVPAEADSDSLSAEVALARAKLPSHRPAAAGPRKTPCSPQAHLRRAFNDQPAV